MRLALEGGQWAELRTRLSYGAAREIRIVLVRVENDRTAVADLDMALIRAYVEAWHVVGFNGELVPLETPDQAPDDVIQSIAIKAIDLWKSTPALPKVQGGRSRSTRPARR